MLRIWRQYIGKMWLKCWNEHLIDYMWGTSCEYAGDMLILSLQSAHIFSVHQLFSSTEFLSVFLTNYGFGHIFVGFLKDFCEFLVILLKLQDLHWQGVPSLSHNSSVSRHLAHNKNDVMDCIKLFCFLTVLH